MNYFQNMSKEVLHVEEQLVNKYKNYVDKNELLLEVESFKYAF